MKLINHNAFSATNMYNIESKTHFSVQYMNDYCTFLNYVEDYWDSNFQFSAYSDLFTIVDMDNVFAFQIPLALHC